MTESLAIKGGVPARQAPFHAWPVHDDAERRAVLEVLDSGKWSFNGPREASFARDFARLCGVREAFCVANGSVSLEIALRALGVGPGDEVLVPALTWPATALAALEVGARPVFVDVGADDWCMDPADVRRKITRRTRALIPVHLYSQVADLDALMAIATERKLWVIEDCAHAVGARWGGRPVGSIGHAGSFSFQQSKGMTCGEGGAVTTSDDALAAKIYGGKNCGRPWKPGAAATFGGNHRMTEFQAAVLGAQLGRLDAQLATKAANVARFREAVADVAGITVLPFKARVTRAGFYGLSVAFDARRFGGLPRDVVLAALRAEGLPVNGTYEPVYRSALWLGGATNRNFGPGASARTWLDLDARCPTAERIAADRGMVIPHEVFLGPPEDMDALAHGFAKVRRLASSLRLDGLKSRARGLLARSLRG